MCVHYYFVGLLQIYLLNKIYSRTGARVLRGILQFELVIYLYIHAWVCVKERGREKDGICVSYIKFQWRIVVASMRQPCGFKFVFTGAHQFTYSYKRMTKRTALLDKDKRERERGR